MSPSAVSPALKAQEVHERTPNGLPEIDAHQGGGDLSYSDAQENEHFGSFSSTETLDLLCIGFGPASLAIAIALHDAQTNTSLSTTRPRVLFLEKQPRFAWHSGMQLPGAKMQISFLKDLATPRDPTSKFTFLNYLFQQHRLNHFINLSTFLPTRVEYEDYLRWCARYFEREGKVVYGMDVQSVRVAEKGNNGQVTSWEVRAIDPSGEVTVRKARHVVIAVGGIPIIPQVLRGLKHVAHSSQFANTISSIQQHGAPDERRLRFAVIGSGQSAAEIFNDLWERFPEADVSLVIKGASLRPSDDSPFVNEIFNPERVSQIYNQAPSTRATALALDRGTNYGVVRLELLEHLYSKIYMQRLQNSSEAQWRCRILHNRAIADAKPASNGAVCLTLRKNEDDGTSNDAEEELQLEVDYVFTATGYARNAHTQLLKGVRELLRDKGPGNGDLETADHDRDFDVPVARDYRVLFEDGKVDRNAGVWLQGCNERTHGLSDTLLSILAVRGGELVDSIFGRG